MDDKEREELENNATPKQGENPKKEKDEGAYGAIGMCLGLSVGMLFGLAVDNLALGICMGMSVGMCIGLGVEREKKKKAEKANQSKQAPKQNPNDTTPQN